MSASPYPVHVEAHLEPRLSRWLWLVKWALAIPHYVVLAFLWLAFGVLSMVAFFAILFTGRYPRSIFDFNVGVLRWTWRVAYYAYGALGTDRYPPFSLAEVADYPAHLEVDYPESLSRGLVLVKWWLLALPHYLVVGVFLGGGLYLTNEAVTGRGAPWLWGGGLVGLLVLVAAVILLFTGRYPQSIFDLVLGMNRWVLRVAAYAGLMTDEYPPFRLDQGGADPGRLELQSRAPLAGPGGSATPAQPFPARPSGTRTPTSSWTAGRIVSLVVASLMVAASLGLLAAGGTVAVADRTLRDDTGFLMSNSQPVSTSLYAVTSTNLELHTATLARRLPEVLLGDTKLTVTPNNDAPVFVGIASTQAVRNYLEGVGHATIVGVQPRTGADRPVYRTRAGGAPSQPPGHANIWAASTAGTGTQSLVWTPKPGDWTVAVMQADASAGIAAGMSAGAEVPAMPWLIAILLSLGGTGLVAGTVVLLVTVSRAGTARRRVPPQHVRTDG